MKTESENVGEGAERERERERVREREKEKERKKERKRERERERKKERKKEMDGDREVFREIQIHRGIQRRTEAEKDRIFRKTGSKRDNVRNGQIKLKEERRMHREKDTKRMK